ncbi:MAG: glutamate-5-semialdehyde dehydrogenase [Deltaproteobacteria bacterium]|nr:glutamate-5-semialdehyde dehydrogenase [Deltaproteobacteria bacterium]
MISKKIEHIAIKTKQASYELTTLDTRHKNRVLKELAVQIHKNRAAIKKANLKDVTEAGRKGLSAAMIDRLVLDDGRIDAMRHSVLEVAGLKDPVGEMTEQRKRNGLHIKKVRIPLGVICMIYESRPNVTVDAASLCFKSGNAVILRGGAEAYHSNCALVGIIRDVLKKNAVDPCAVSMVPFTDRSAMIHLLQMDRYINVVIPRGGEGLMRFIGDHTKIPVIKHDKGVCSLFVDESADILKAVRVIENAKVQRPGVCNALEQLYVHKKIAAKFLPEFYRAMTADHVEIRGDHQTRKIIPAIKLATDKDFGTEYLDLILAVKVVTDVRDAISHVIRYSSDHTDGIITKNKKNAGLFARAINSSCVMINTSTRFNDGGELGLGAEIGIATTRLHAYGPMGLRELTAQKFVVESDYRIRGG